MATDAAAVPVTRRELYNALSIVWLFILIVLGDMTDGQRWNEVVLFVVAFLCALYYAVKAKWSRPRVTTP